MKDFLNHKTFILLMIFTTLFYLCWDMAKLENKVDNLSDNIGYNCSVNYGD